VLGHVGDIHRFASRDQFAAYNGTAPIEASSGRHIVHRLRGAVTGSSTTPSTWPPSPRSATTAPPGIYDERKIAEGMAALPRSSARAGRVIPASRRSLRRGGIERV